MDTICRLCSTKSKNLISIFTFKRDRLLSDMILLICPIRIDASDDLPKSICEICLKSVLDAIELREKSVKSELKFRGQTFAIENPRSIKLSQELNPFLIYNESDEEKSQNDGEQSMEEDESDYNPVNPFTSRLKTKKSKYRQVANGVQCPHCPATFTFATNARRHVRQIHNSDYSIKKKDDKESGHFCDECGATFSFATNLRRHMRQVHCRKFNIQFLKVVDKFKLLKY